MTRFVYEVPAQNPRGPKGDHIVLALEPTQPDWLIRHVGAYMLHNLGLVASKVLKDPELIFDGVRPDDSLHADFNEEESYCYCARQAVGYDNEGRQRSAPANHIFCVFVSEKWIYHWGFVKADRGDPRQPINAHGRFARGIIWPPD